MTSFSSNDVSEIVRRLEAAGALGQGGRMPALLRYLLQEEAAGRGERLRAHAIATEVLGRASSFDPQEDSIVRVEIGRLRKALDYYYATEGKDEPLRISIPRGTYRPDIATISESPGPSRADGRQVGRKLSVLVLVTAGVALLIAALLWGGRSQFGRAPEPAAYSGATPRLVLLPFEGGDAAARELTPGLRAQLVSLLAQQPWLSVSVQESFVPRPPVPPKLFSLTGVLETGAGGYVLQALLHTEPEHRVVWTGRYSGSLHKSALDLARGIAQDLAGDLGYPLGPMGRAIAANSTATEPEIEDRFLCMMNAYRYRLGRSTKQREDAEACLTRLTARFPDFHEGRAMLALFATQDARSEAGGKRDEALLRAETLLRGAPDEDRLAGTGRMILAACRDDLDGLRRSARALLASAPNDPDTLAEAANWLGLGALDWELAIDAEGRAQALSYQSRPLPAHARSAKALLDGRFDLALSSFGPSQSLSTPLEQTTLLILATLADAPLRARSAAEALTQNTGLNRDVLVQQIERSCWHPRVRKAFIEALDRALPPAGPAPPSTSR